MLVDVRDVNVKILTGAHVNNNVVKVANELLSGLGLYSVLERHYRFAALVVQTKSMISEDAGNNLQSTSNTAK